MKLPAALTLFALAGCRPAPVVPLGEVQDGIATYYDATGAGNCSFDPTGDLNVAAMNAEQYARSAACGECVRVEGPKGVVTVRIVDQCPECQRGHLDLSREAFAQVATLADGRVPVRWTVVACDVGGSLAYRFKEGSSQYWTALQVRNHRLPIRSLELRSGSGWVDLPRESYNYFVAAQGVGTGAFTVRVTSSDGQQLEDALQGVRDGQVVSGAVQFR
jgi:expansin